MGRTFLQRLAADRGGNTLAIFAASLVPLTLLVGSGLDLGVRYMAQAKLQNACDAGVLAGRQIMRGNEWSTAAENEAERFFGFNFPQGTHGATGVDFQVEPNPDDPAEILGRVEGEVPTSIMRLAGYESLSIAAECDAKRDLGHNDVMLVLDVTGSMRDAPSSGGGTKIGRLRTGAAGLYRALAEDANGSITRFGIMPYSQTVNVGRSLQNRDILINQEYVDEQCSWRGCTYGRKIVHISRSTWGNGRGGNEEGNRQGFRTSGNACIEERPTIGNDASPIRIESEVSRADIDAMPRNGSDEARQWGRYDPGVQEGSGGNVCPSEATRLRTYSSESSFTTAINAATARVNGNTYHDMGMIWGARFISRTGMFTTDNPTERSNVPVNQHIVFMTDGEMMPNDGIYSAHSIERFMRRTQGSGTSRQRHTERFLSACQAARAMGITVWVIALDVGNTDDIEGCATSAGHFFTSDGSDLESVFERIGQGIGNLRLTQ